MADNRKLSTREAIHARMRDYDLKYQQSLYRQVAYALGEKWNGRLPGHTNRGEFPVFADLQPTYVRVGQSRRILNTQFIGMARVMQTEPEPESPQVDKWTGEVRKQFYLERFRYHEWAEAHLGAFLDGEAAGVGIVQVGMAVNPETGMPHVDCQHIPCFNFVYDRHQRTPNRARWCYAVHYMDTDDAVAQYGEDARKHEMTVEESGDGHPMKAVRVFEYFDVGIAGKNPTRMVVLGQLGQDPVEYGPNPYGPCLPFGFFVYFLAPGMRRPMGRIPFQMATQEAINDIEAYMRAQMKQPEFTLVDSQSLHSQDLQSVIGGKVPAYVRIERPPQAGMTAPVVRVPSGGLHQAVIALQEALERQFTADSGTTEFDRGMQASTDRTLGENMLVDQRGGVQAAWSEHMAAKAYRRTIERVFKIASMVDRDPVAIDVFGTNYTVNSPEDPDSYINIWLEEPSVIVIDAQSLRRQDGAMKAAQRLQQLEVLAPHVGAGIDPIWFVQEKLKAIGEQDPREAMGGADQAGQMQTGLPQGGMMPDNGQPTPAGQPAY